MRERRPFVRIALLAFLAASPAFAAFSGPKTNAQCIGNLSPVLSKAEFARALKKIEKKTAKALRELDADPEPYALEFVADGKAASRRKKLVASGKFRWDARAKKLEYVGERRFLSSESGLERLKTVRLSFVGGDRVAGSVLADYARVLNEVDDLDLLVSYREYDRPFIDAFLKRNPKLKKRVRFVESEKVTGATIWTQDGSKPFIAETESTLGSDPASRSDYLDLLTDLDAKDALHLESNGLPFQGGNVIVGNRNVFVGRNLVDQISVEYGITPENVLEILERKWGNPVVPVGAARKSEKGIRSLQADYHIDLSIAVVADSATKKEKILIGRYDEFMKAVAAMDAADLPTGIETTLGWLDSQPDLLKHLLEKDRFFDAMEADFRARGYEVVRIPGFVDHGTPVYNYTNVVLTPGHVVFPDNQFPVLDQAVAEQYSTAGYRPIPAKTIQFSKNAQGGVRCLSETFRYNFCTLPISAGKLRK